MRYLNHIFKIFEYEINDTLDKCVKYKINKFSIDDDGLLNVHESVNLSYSGLCEIPLKFKEVFGDFIISNNFISDLTGSPIIVHGDYNISNNIIKTIKNSAHEIDGNFILNDNYFLVDITNFPVYVGDGINISSCSALKSLYGCCTNVNGDFFVYNNPKLKSLRYGPNKVNGSYYCYNCNLTTLYGSPHYVECNFHCSNNKLTSLKYSPKYIGDNFIFINNDIRSFYYISEYIGGTIYCENNPVYNIWVLFENKKYIEYFNQMKIVVDENKIKINKLNLFLKSINKPKIEGVDDYINI